MLKNCQKHFKNLSPFFKITYEIRAGIWAGIHQWGIKIFRICLAIFQHYVWNLSMNLPMGYYLDKIIL